MAEGAYEIECWLSESEINSLAYSDYWNNEDEEKNKDWYVLNGDFSRMERYLTEEGFIRVFDDCVSLSRSLGRSLCGVGADIAAGVLWAVPHILRSGSVEKVYCIEYSKHRLLKIGPKVLEHYGVPVEKAVLCLGSFYSLKLPDSSLDFIVLSTAFHHADYPDKLLAELRRVLRPKGVILLFGEGEVHKVTLMLFVKKAAVSIISLLPKILQRFLFGKVFPLQGPFPSRKDLHPPNDPVMGDHYYTRNQYIDIFKRAGFSVHLCRETIGTGCVLVPVTKDTKEGW